MDYSKVLYSKTVQDIHNRNTGRRNSINTTISSTSRSIDLVISPDNNRHRQHSVTSVSTCDSFFVPNQDAKRHQVTSCEQHQNDSGVEDDDHQASTSSQDSNSDDWFSACDSSSLDDSETFHSAISAQCLHQSDDEEDLTTYENSEDCRRYMAKIVDRLYSEE